MKTRFGVAEPEPKEETVDSVHPSRIGNVMKIRNIKTGLVSERQPPDAAEAVATGGWAFVPADSPSIGEILATLGPVELNRLAAEAGVRTHNERPHDIITALTPFIEQGTTPLGADQNRATPATDSDTKEKST